MPEQLRIVRRQHERRAIHDFFELLNLHHARFEKMLRMTGRGLQRGGGIIDLFVRRVAWWRKARTDWPSPPATSSTGSAPTWSCTTFSRITWSYRNARLAPKA